MRKCTGLVVVTALAALGHCQSTDAVAQEKVKLRQGIKCEIGGKLVSHLRFSNFDKSIGIKSSPTANGWLGKSPSGEVFEGFTAQLEQEAGMYQLAHDIATGKNGSANRFGCRIIFDDTDGKEKISFLYNECWMSQIVFPGTDEIDAGHGVSVSFLSALPRVGDTVAVARTVWDSRSEVWHSMRVFINGQEAPAIVDVDPITITLPRFPDRTRPEGLVRTSDFDIRIDKDRDGFVLPSSFTMKIEYRSKDGGRLTLNLGLVGRRALVPKHVFDVLETAVEGKHTLFFHEENDWIWDKF